MTNEESPSPLQWRAHPWHQESPGKSTALVGIIVSVGAVTAWSFAHILYGLGAILVLLAATSRYLLPTEHLVDAKGASSTHLGFTHKLRWQQIARVDVHGDGLFLSPFSQASRLDSFRGLFLRYADNGGRVAVAVDHWRRSLKNSKARKDSEA